MLSHSSSEPLSTQSHMLSARMTSVEPRTRNWPAYSSACRQSIIGCSLLGTPAEATWRGVSQLQDFQPIFPKVSGSIPLGMQSPVTQRTTALGVGKLQAFQPIEGTRQSPEYPVVAAFRSHLLSTEVGWAAAAVLREYLQPPRNKVKLARGRREAEHIRLIYSTPLGSAHDWCTGLHVGVIVPAPPSRGGAVYCSGPRRRCARCCPSLTAKPPTSLAACWCVEASRVRVHMMITDWMVCLAFAALRRSAIRQRGSPRPMRCTTRTSIDSTCPHGSAPSARSATRTARGCNAPHRPRGLTYGE